MSKKHPLDVALNHAIKGNADKSEEILNTLPKDDPRVLFNLGWHELRKGNLYKGYEKLNAGRWINSFGSPPLPANTPIWAGSNPTLLLRSEGGLGDHIANARFAKQLSKYGEVTLTTDASLVGLLSQIDGVSNCVCECEGIPFHNAWIPAMSAPYLLKMEYGDLSGKPYLRATPRKLEGKFKIGLRWSGNPQFEHEQHRKFDKKLMLDLAKIEGPTFYSLQRDHDLIDVPFTDLRDELKTWEDTASILSGLDLVITSDTSIAHCAGALGVPTWIVVPILPYYMWSLPGNTTPWYDSVRLFRQVKYGKWDKPFNDIKTELLKIL